MGDMRSWVHYFLDLPLYAAGIRLKRVGDWDAISGDRPHTLDGIEYLRECLGARVSAVSDREITRLANEVRLIRESDIYASQMMTRKNMNRWFRIEGLENLEKASKECRPIALLSAHMGSNYTSWIGLDFADHTTFVVARDIDHSPATPISRRLYMAATYRLTGRKWGGSYLYADSHGRFPKGELDRILDTVFARQGLCFVAIDFPPTLFSGKQLTVNFLGRPAQLPVSFLHLGISKKVRFFAFWDGIDFDHWRPLRHIRISALPESADAGEILQAYADRLTEFIAREPWQWIGLPIARQYHTTR